jgi:hypothetical protein
MRNKHGNIPNIEVLHYDGTELVYPVVAVTIDNNPTTFIKINHGGMASGFIKIGK